MATNEFNFERAVERLKRPFAFRDLEWVSNFSYGDDYQSAVIAVAPYVRRESIITRFNIVCGKHNWKNELLPLGKAGLYQAILLRYKDEWIPNWDGAAMSETSTIDPVKGSCSRSLRRAAEMWDVGLYTQFVPQLYAQKRPSKDYDAYDKFSKKSWNFNVRWDRPVLPREFLPRYMTPEQYNRMLRLIKYLDGESEEKFQKLIDSWEEDCDSIPYEKAEELITAVQGNIHDRLDKINKQSVSPRKENKNKQRNDTSSGGQKNTKDKGAKDQRQPRGQSSSEGQSQSSSKQAPPASQGKGIDKGKVSQLIANIKKIDNDDPNGIYLDRDWVKEIKQNVNKHSSSKHKYFISLEQFNDWMERFAAAFDEMDDLPF